MAIGSWSGVWPCQAFLHLRDVMQADAKRDEEKRRDAMRGDKRRCEGMRGNGDNEMQRKTTRGHERQRRHEAIKSDAESGDAGRCEARQCGAVQTAAEQQAAA